MTTVCEGCGEEFIRHHSTTFCPDCESIVHIRKTKQRPPSLRRERADPKRDKCKKEQRITRRRTLAIKYA